MSRAVVLAAVVLMGCRYQRPVIYLPPSEATAECAARATEDYERCLTYQRGRAHCARMQDRAFLMCPGAREGGPDGGEVTSTYELPGFKP